MKRAHTHTHTDIDICVHFDLEVIRICKYCLARRAVLDFIHASFEFAAISIDLFELPFEVLYKFCIFPLWQWDAIILIGLTFDAG